MKLVVIGGGSTYTPELADGIGTEVRMSWPLIGGSTKES